MQEEKCLSREGRNREIEQLNQRISELKTQKQTIDSETQDRADKRDKLNEQFRNLRSEITDLRSQRDTLNDEVQNLKLQRTAVRDQIREKIDKIKKLRPKSKVLAETRPSRSHQSLQQEVESIDWEIQTSILTKEEEKELVEQVKELEEQLVAHKKYEHLITKIHALQEEIMVVDAQGKAFHDKLKGTAQRSQTIHQKMLEKIEESKKVKAEADKFHQLFVEGREKSRAVQAEISSVSTRLRQLRGEIKGEEAQEKRRSEESLREKIESEAREKLQRGDKLTLDEFKLLAGDDGKEQDQS